MECNEVTIQSDIRLESSPSKKIQQHCWTLLNIDLNPVVLLHRVAVPPDLQQLLVIKEEVPPELQERSSSLDQG